jgi:dTDP-4-dehydrorhamnose reductase
MRLLITGGSGLLGSRVTKLAPQEHKVTATYNRSKIEADYPLVSLDITKREDVLSLVSELNPDAVIHCAALTNVDYCEDHKEEAMLVNARATGYLSEACERAGAKMLYVSTDFVFDGEKGMYSEEDEVNPINHYGFSKLEGEKEVLACSDYAIARASVLYGWNVQRRLNFVTWVIDRLEKGKEVNIVTDQYASPTLADDAAEAFLRIIERGKKGVFHTAGGERINRYDFARKIAEVFSLKEELINPITSEDLKQTAMRPMDSSLNVRKAERELGIKMMTVREGLERMGEVPR